MRQRTLPAFLAGCLLMCFVTMSSAQANEFTFIFDYRNAGSTITPGGPWGTLTIKDSSIDPNRVDLFLSITPPASYTLDQFYLNLDLDPDTPPVGNDPDLLPKFLTYLVKQSTPATGASNAPFAAGDLLGSVSLGITLNGFAFDLTPNPTSSALTFDGSLSLYQDNNSPTLDSPFDLNANMFFTPSVVTGSLNIPIYAAYRSFSTTGLPEFRAFASSVVPEPATLLLLGTGLGVVSLAAWRRKR